MSSTEPPPPPHALYVQYGKFKAGAFGPYAIIVVAIITIVVVAAWCYFAPGAPPPKLPALSRWFGISFSS
jgi:hypothetical protein